MSRHFNSTHSLTARAALSVWHTHTHLPCLSAGKASFLISGSVGRSLKTDWQTELAATAFWVCILIIASVPDKMTEWTFSAPFEKYLRDAVSCASQIPPEEHKRRNCLITCLSEQLRSSFFLDDTSTEIIWSWDLWRRGTLIYLSELMKPSHVCKWWIFFKQLLQSFRHSPADWPHSRGENWNLCISDGIIEVHVNSKG